MLAFCIWTRVVAGDGFLLSFIELLAVLAALAAAVLVRGARNGTAFAATAVTMAAVVVSILSELYPRVMVSSLGAANDLTTENTASASYALTVMTVLLVVLLPVVLLYQAWTYVVFRRRLSGSRVGGDEPGPAIPAQREEEAPAGAPAGREPAPSLPGMGSAHRNGGWRRGPRK